MPLVCPCPPVSEITDIPADSCIKRIGQVQKFLLQRTYSSGATLNVITIGSTAPTLLATWTDLMAATDNTKIQATPFVTEPAFEQGEQIAYGGGNETPDGITINMGRNPTPFTGSFLDLDPSIEIALQAYECEKRNLSVYLINEADQIIGITDDLTTPTTMRGIPLRSFFISDRVPGGKEVPDKNFVGFQFTPNWSNYLYFVTPTAFSPILQLNAGIS